MPEAASDDAGENIRNLVQKLQEAGLEEDEIVEQLTQVQERQSGRVTSDWREVQAERTEHESGHGRTTETWEVPTGHVEKDGAPVLLKTVVEEPDNLDAMLISLAQARDTGGEVERQAWESVLREVIVEPSAFQVFSSHLQEQESLLEKYEDEDNDHYPMDEVDSYWTMPPAYRVTLKYKLYAWLGLNPDFMEALGQMSVGQSTRRQMSSTWSRQNIQSILDDLSESSKKREDGEAETSSDTTAPSDEGGTESGESDSTTTSGSSQTSSTTPSEEKTPSTSRTQTNKSERTVRPVKRDKS